MRLFAIVPAAGLSRRMGQPKLVMDLLGKPVVQWLLETLAQPEISATAIVMRNSDEPLHSIVAQLPAMPVLPEIDPPDMRTSVEHGLTAIEQAYSPEPEDAWLLVPADHPILDVITLRELIVAWKNSPADILIPCHSGRRGHPTFFRWKLASRVRAIPEDHGINWLLSTSDLRVEEFNVASESILLDLDTRDEFDSIRQTLELNCGPREGGS